MPKLSSTGTPSPQSSAREEKPAGNIVGLGANIKARAKAGVGQSKTLSTAEDFLALPDPFFVGLGQLLPNGAVKEVDAATYRRVSSRNLQASAPDPGQNAKLQITFIDATPDFGFINCIAFYREKTGGDKPLMIFPQPEVFAVSELCNITMALAFTAPKQGTEDGSLVEWDNDLRRMVRVEGKKPE